VLAAAALAATAGSPVSSRSAGGGLAYPDTFPAGAARVIAERACLFCHSPMLVTQQAKDSAGWQRSLATMESWGAPLTPAELDSLRDYLLTRFGPRKAGAMR